MRISSHIHQNNQYRVWHDRSEHQESFEDIIVLLMQSMKTDGEFYGMTLGMCVCLCVCAQREGETADFAEILKDRKQNGPKKKKQTLSFFPSFFPSSIIFLLCVIREKESVCGLKKEQPHETVCVCDH